MSVRRSQKGSSQNSPRSTKRNEPSARKRERPPSTTRREGGGDADRVDRAGEGADDGPLSRTRRTVQFLVGNWGAVARTTAVIVVLAGAISYFDLEVEVFGVTFSATKTCQIEVAEPPVPYPPAPYPAPHPPVPPYPPQVNQGQEQPANPPS